MWLPLYYFCSSYIGAVKVCQKYRTRLELLENLSKFAQKHKASCSQKRLALQHWSFWLKDLTKAEKEIFPEQNIKTLSERYKKKRKEKTENLKTGTTRTGTARPRTTCTPLDELKSDTAGVCYCPVIRVVLCTE